MSICKRRKSDQRLGFRPSHPVLLAANARESGGWSGRQTLSETRPDRKSRDFPASTKTLAAAAFVEVSRPSALGAHRSALTERPGVPCCVERCCGSSDRGERGGLKRSFHPGSPTRNFYQSDAIHGGRTAKVVLPTIDLFAPVPVFLQNS